MMEASRCGWCMSVSLVQFCPQETVRRSARQKIMRQIGEGVGVCGACGACAVSDVSDVSMCVYHSVQDFCVCVCVFVLTYDTQTGTVNDS